jgi:hypothetical protein
MVLLCLLLTQQKQVVKDKGKQIQLSWDCFFLPAVLTSLQFMSLATRTTSSDLAAKYKGTKPCNYCNPVALSPGLLSRHHFMSLTISKNLLFMVTTFSQQLFSKCLPPTRTL